jgi:restriction system protein
MSDDLIRIGQKTRHLSANRTRVLRYVVEMSHAGLNEHKVISAPDEFMLNNKIELQKRKWMEKWTTISSRRKISAEKEANIEEANRRTEDAINALRNIENIVGDSLSVNNAIDWENSKKKGNYPETKPTRPVPIALWISNVNFIYCFR